MTPVRQFLVPVLVTAFILWAALCWTGGDSVVWLVIGTCMGLMREAAFTSWAKIRAERPSKPQD